MTTFTDELVAISCGECGTAFGLSRRFYDARRDDHKTFYCPNGHPRAYNGKSDLEVARENEKWYRERYDERGNMIARLTATNVGLRANNTRKKRELAKLKTRAAAGVCPCCHRTIKQLAAHMASKHPEFSA